MSGIVCPNCNKRGFGIIKGRKKNSLDTKKRQSALFGCEYCSYTEVI